MAHRKGAKTMNKKILMAFLLIFAFGLILTMSACGPAINADNSEHYEGEDYYADYVDIPEEGGSGDLNIGAAAKVTFDASGATGAPSEITAKVGDKITIPASDISLEGYDFGGWSDGVRYYYSGNEMTVSSEKTTLTARWIEQSATYFIHGCDDEIGWWSDAAVKRTDGENEGDQALINTSSSCIIFCYAFEPFDLSAFYEGGALTISVWIDDASKMQTGDWKGRIELSDDDGKTFTCWETAMTRWQDGWNHLVLPTEDAVTDQADYTKINYFRLFQHVTEETSIKIDNIAYTGGDGVYGIRYESGFTADAAIAPTETASLSEGTRVILPECEFRADGMKFVGWSDGETVIPAGERYFMPARNVIMTAVWEEYPTRTISYNIDGGKGSLNSVDGYAGKWVKLSEKTPVKAGYSFDGWSDGSKIYTPGELVCMPDADLALTAVWSDIVMGNMSEGLVEGWNFNDGGTSGKVLSDVKLGADGSHKWGTWLNSETFGKTLDFSTEGSFFAANDTKADLSGDFALSAWIKAPVRENEDRVIMMIGDSEAVSEGYVDKIEIDEIRRQNGWGCDEFVVDDESGRRYVTVKVRASSEAGAMPKALTPVDISGYENGYVHISVYLSNDANVTGQIELTSSGGSDKDELAWELVTLYLKAGWNELYLPINGAVVTGTPNLSKINCFRIYAFSDADVTVGIDDIYACKKTVATPADGAMLFLDASENMALAFEADGMSGLESSGVSLADGKWHHVAVSREGDSFTYYIDGTAVKTCTVSGTPTVTASDVYVGSALGGPLGFDGSVAEVRIYNTAKTPDNITDTVIAEADNQPKSTRLNLKKGLVFDRRQYYAPRPYESEGQTVTKDDVINAINMGFDHVKILLTPNHLINEDGSLKRENLEYITEVVNYVIELDYVCYICIHPELDFKPTYLGNLDNFELLCRWYGEMAAYIGETWDADHVGLQLMTEPTSQNSTVSWTWLSDRMWSAVRNVLPDHTLITSSDSLGNMERLKLMSPATDENLIYSFTTYEPYTIGWYYYFSHPVAGSFWKYIKEVPYPVEEGVDYTEAIENSIELVPANLKAEARAILTDYVNGKCDWTMPNYYEGQLYNRDWHFARAKSLDEWSKKYGGNIHMMAVEWGCFDNVTSNRYFKNNVPEGTGCPDDQREEFIKDMRESFEEYGIGWSYWSYNEAHTVFRPEVHYYGESPDPETAITMYDWTMLKDCLGLTPKVEEPTE